MKYCTLLSYLLLWNQSDNFDVYNSLKSFPPVTPTTIHTHKKMSLHQHFENCQFNHGVNTSLKMSCSTSNRRIKIDVMRLIASNFDVTTFDNYRHLVVKFHGPAGTPYEGGVWRVRVNLPENYPFKSPSVGFDTQIFHPNVDQTSGTVCLDVLNQKWTALYDLVIIFDTFLPQLLKNPNPDDPLNQCAAMVLTRTPERYKHVVEKHVQEFANPEKIKRWEGVKDVDGEPDESMSELSDNENG